MRFTWHTPGVYRETRLVKSHHRTCLHPRWPLSAHQVLQSQHQSRSSLHLLPGPPRYPIHWLVPWSTPHNIPYIQWAKVPLVCSQRSCEFPSFSSSPPTRTSPPCLPGPHKDLPAGGSPCFPLEPCRLHPLTTGSVLCRQRSS